MAAVFWLLILGAGVVTGQPWAILIAIILVICFGLANTPAKAPRAEAQAPIVPDLPVDPRQLKRKWRLEEHRVWQEDFDRLVAAAGRRPDLPDRPQRRT